MREANAKAAEEGALLRRRYSSSVHLVASLQREIAALREQAHARAAEADRRVLEQEKEEKKDEEDEEENEEEESEEEEKGEKEPPAWWLAEREAVERSLGDQVSVLQARVAEQMRVQESMLHAMEVMDQANMEEEKERPAEPAKKADVADADRSSMVEDTASFSVTPPAPLPAHRTVIRDEVLPSPRSMHRYGRLLAIQGGSHARSVEEIEADASESDDSASTISVTESESESDEEEKEEEEEEEEKQLAASSSDEDSDVYVQRFKAELHLSHSKISHEPSPHSEAKLVAEARAEEILRASRQLIAEQRRRKEAAAAAAAPREAPQKPLHAPRPPVTITVEQETTETWIDAQHVVEAEAEATLQSAQQESHAVLFRSPMLPKSASPSRSSTHSRASNANAHSTGSLAESLKDLGYHEVDHGVRAGVRGDVVQRIVRVGNQMPPRGAARPPAAAASETASSVSGASGVYRDPSFDDDLSSLLSASTQLDELLSNHAGGRRSRSASVERRETVDGESELGESEKENYAFLFNYAAKSSSTSMTTQRVTRPSTKRSAPPTGSSGASSGLDDEYGALFSIIEEMELHSSSSTSFI